MAMFHDIQIFSSNSEIINGIVRGMSARSLLYVSLSFMRGDNKWATVSHKQCIH